MAVAMLLLPLRNCFEIEKVKNVEGLKLSGMAILSVERMCPGTLTHPAKHATPGSYGNKTSAGCYW